MGKSIYDQFKHAANAYPNNTAAVFEGHKWTFKELDREIDTASRKLVTLGVKEKDVVAVAMPNCPEALFLFYAISKIGAISYNIHPLTPASLMAVHIKKSGAKILICLANACYDHRMVLPDSVKIVSVNPYWRINLIKALVLFHISKRAHGIKGYAGIHPAKSSPTVHPDPDDDAVYLNTGGTNGEPKIVRLSSRSINNLALKGYPLFGGRLKDIKMLTAIPLFHGFGLAMGVHTPISWGASTVLVLKFNTREAIRYIRKGEATVIIGVPALYNALLSRESFYGPWLKKQIVAFIGGDSVPESLLDQWNTTMSRFLSSARLFEGYGLTETVNVTNVNTYGRAKRGTIGKPLPNLREIIVDPETGAPLPAGESGEICIGGDCLMNGYLNDEELTQKSFLTIEGRRYFRTRDFGYIDEDGYLTFRQRLRRIVKINGETVCPSDVEDVALSLFDVYEAYCFPVEDKRKGHVLCLAVVQREGPKGHVKEEAIEQEIYAAVQKNLPPQYKPAKIIFLEHLPRTPVGKIDAAEFEKIKGEIRL